MAIDVEGCHKVYFEGSLLGHINEVDPGVYLFEPEPEQNMSQSMLRDIATALDKLDAVGDIFNT